MNSTKSFCNFCGTEKWGDMGARLGVRCEKCGSLERTRVTKMLLEKFDVLRRGIKVLHFAPEMPVYDLISRLPDVSYHAVDLFPELFRFGEITRFDICEEVASLPSEEYDLIIHSHVMEHIPCNITAVLFHLQRALRPSGLHVMCVPISGGCYAEDLGNLTEVEATVKYGQKDHVRRIGRDDIARTLGMVLRMPAAYNLYDHFEKSDLDRYNIPEGVRQGLTGSSVLSFKKTDLLLR